MSKYQLIVFDFDGTLADTAPDIANSANWVLRQLGYEKKSLNEVKRAIGFGVRDLMKKLIFNGESKDEAPEEAVNLFRKHYKDHCVDESQPYPGVKEALQGPLKNFKKVVVTNKPHDLALSMLNDLGLSQYFLHVIGTGFNYLPKPSPEATFKVMEWTTNTAEKTILIGDSAVDCQTASHAEIDFGWVDYGYDAQPEGPTHYIFSSANQWGKIQ